jgi:hypothetical protein
MYSTLQMLDKLVAEAKEALAKSSECFMFGLPDWKAMVVDDDIPSNHKEGWTLFYTRAAPWYLRCRWTYASLSIRVSYMRYRSTCAFWK